MLETVARWFEVDTATSKVTCIDLMRANPFDVVIASERLSDGSGLELLSHVATRWPNTLRVLVIEPARLRLLKGKLAPFRLHATMKYPIEEDELETVLNRMGELMETAEAEEDEEEPAPEPAPPVAPAPPTIATKVQKVTLSQQVAKASSSASQGSVKPAGVRPAGLPMAGGAGASSAASPSKTPASASGGRPGSSSAGAASGSRPGLSSGAPTSGSSSAPSSSRLTARAAKAALPLGAPVPPSPPLVRRKLGNYTPLGAPEDEKMRIVEREFDRTIAPLAARAMRAREEASRPPPQKEKLGSMTTHLRNTLKRLLKR